VRNAQFRICDASSRSLKNMLLLLELLCGEHGQNQTIDPLHIYLAFSSVIVACSKDSCSDIYFISNLL
jgi:hypothetical protein